MACHEAAADTQCNAPDAARICGGCSAVVGQSRSYYGGGADQVPTALEQPAGVDQPSHEVRQKKRGTVWRARRTTGHAPEVPVIIARALGS